LIAEVAVEWALNHLPGMLVRRMYPPQKIEQEISIDFRAKNPINASNVMIPDNGPFPCAMLDLWLTVRNESAIDVVLDRLLFEFWIGQPLVIGAMLRRDTIKRHRSLDVCHRTILGEAEISRIKSYREDSSRFESMSLNAEAFGDSVAGPIRVARYGIEREKKYIMP
jgi:hypothetical protein